VVVEKNWFMTLRAPVGRRVFAGGGSSRLSGEGRKKSNHCFRSTTNFPTKNRWRRKGGLRGEGKMYRLRPDWDREGSFGKSW